MIVIIRRLAAALALGLSLGTTGCYNMRPTELSGGISGQRVVIGLTDEGSREMTPLVGADAVSLEGVVIQAEAERWLLSMRSVQHTSGGTRWNGESIAVPASAMESVVEKRLSRSRTGLLIGGIVAGAIALAHEFIDIGPSDGGDGGGSPVPGQ